MAATCGDGRTGCVFADDSNNEILLVPAPTTASTVARALDRG